jgi:tetratricopeptide (TPR) repeat protein
MLPSATLAIANAYAYAIHDVVFGVSRHIDETAASFSSLIGHGVLVLVGGRWHRPRSVAKFAAIARANKFDTPRELFSPPLDAQGYVVDEPLGLVLAMRNRKRRNRGSDSKVIHVSFGQGGGRLERQAHLPGMPSVLDEAPERKEPAADVYTQTEVARLLGMTPGRLRSLDRAGIVSPSGRRKGRRAYTFRDLIALRAARDLLASRVRLRDVARAIKRIRETLPSVARPLSELRIASDGHQVVVRTREGSFQPLTGQMVMDFDVQQLHNDVVRMLRPSAGRDRARTAYELYLQASQLDEDPETMDEAEALYRAALRYDPWLAIVYTNLGNIRFRRGDEEQAERLYRCALEIEDQQPEAQYNLGYMMLHRGEPDGAIRFFEGAIDSDPRFADAYFNLAMALEQAGESGRARTCWRRYLDIEPTGTWAEIARQHLGE